MDLMDLTMLILCHLCPYCKQQVKVSAYLQFCKILEPWGFCNIQIHFCEIVWSGEHSWTHICMSKFTFLPSKVIPHSSFCVKHAQTIGASTWSTDEQPPTMRVKLCSRRCRIDLDGKWIIFFRYAYCHSLKLVSCTFLQGEIKSIVQMIFENLLGSKSAVFLDVPAILLATLLPNLPPSPILSPSSPHLALPAPLASSLTCTL